MNRILITGGHGMLASDLQRFMTDLGEYEVIAPSHAELDVADAVGLREAVSQLRPDALIHTAALHVDPCEDDPEAAFRVNAWATRNVARACEATACKLIYISTCGLFGDKVKAYSEYDAEVLKTQYARSKAAGEVFVRQFCERHFIVRPGWLFGGSVEHAKNFVVRRFEEASKTSVVQSAYDKHGSPTYTGDVAHTIAGLLQGEEFGTYHVTNQGAATRASYVRRIVECFGLDTTVEEVDSSHYPRKADVPDCEILCSLNLGYAGLEQLPPWDEAIERYVAQIKQQLS